MDTKLKSSCDELDPQKLKVFELPAMCTHIVNFHFKVGLIGSLFSIRDA